MESFQLFAKLQKIVASLLEDCLINCESFTYQNSSLKEKKT